MRPHAAIARLRSLSAGRTLKRVAHRSRTRLVAAPAAAKTLKLEAAKSLTLARQSPRPVLDPRPADCAGVVVSQSMWLGVWQGSRFFFAVSTSIRPGRLAKRIAEQPRCRGGLALQVPCGLATADLSESGKEAGSSSRCRLQYALAG